MTTSRTTSGYSTVETLVALALLALLVSSVGAMMLHAQSVAYDGLLRSQARFCAAEGLEAVRSMGNDEAVVIPGVHGLTFESGYGEFFGTEDTDGQFTRTIEVTDIALSLRRVSVAVTWESGTGGGVEVAEDIFVE